MKHQSILFYPSTVNKSLHRSIELLSIELPSTAANMYQVSCDHTCSPYCASDRLLLPLTPMPGFQQNQYHQPRWGPGPSQNRHHIGFHQAGTLLRYQFIHASSGTILDGYIGAHPGLARIDTNNNTGVGEV